MSYSSKPNQSLSCRSLRWSVCSQSKADLLLFPVVDCIILSSFWNTAKSPLTWKRNSCRFVSICFFHGLTSLHITCKLHLRRPLRTGSPQMKSFGPSGSGSSRGMIVGWPWNKAIHAYSHVPSFILDRPCSLSFSELQNSASSESGRLAFLPGYVCQRSQTFERIQRFQQRFQRLCLGSHGLRRIRCRPHASDSRKWHGELCEWSMKDEQ